MGARSLHVCVRACMRAPVCVSLCVCEWGRVRWRVVYCNFLRFGACARTSYFFVVALCTFCNCFCTGSFSEIWPDSIISLSYVLYTAIISLSDACALGRLDRARGQLSYCQGPG